MLINFVGKIKLDFIGLMKYTGQLTYLRNKMTCFCIQIFFIIVFIIL